MSKKLTTREELYILVDPPERGHAERFHTLAITILVCLAIVLIALAITGGL